MDTRGTTRVRVWLLPVLLVANGLAPIGVRPVDAWYGGNIVVTLKEGRNLPQLDSFGPMGGDTDAYIQVGGLEQQRGWARACPAVITRCVALHAFFATHRSLLAKAPRWSSESRQRRPTA